MRSRRSLPIVSVNSFLFPSPVAVCVCVCVCVNDVNDLWLWCIISFFFLSLSDFFERRHLRVVFFFFPFFFFLSFSFHHGGPNGRCRATHRLLPSYHCWWRHRYSLVFILFFFLFSVVVVVVVVPVIIWFWSFPVSSIDFEYFFLCWFQSCSIFFFKSKRYFDVIRVECIGNRIHDRTWFGFTSLEPGANQQIIKVQSPPPSTRNQRLLSATANRWSSCRSTHTAAVPRRRKSRAK